MCNFQQMQLLVVEVHLTLKYNLLGHFLAAILFHPFALQWTAPNCAVLYCNCNDCGVFVYLAISNTHGVEQLLPLQRNTSDNKLSARRAAITLQILKRESK